MVLMVHRRLECAFAFLHSSAHDSESDTLPGAQLNFEVRTRGQLGVVVWNGVIFDLD